MIHLNDLSKELTEVIDSDLVSLVGGGFGNLSSSGYGFSLSKNSNYNTSFGVRDLPNFTSNNASLYNTSFIAPLLPSSVPPQFAAQTLGFIAGDGNGSVVSSSPVGGFEFKRQFTFGD
jgi:hypothetical protein